MNVKNGIRKTLASLLVVVLLLTSAPLAGVADLDFSGVADWFSTTAKAATYTEGYLKYKVENGEATITGCDSSIGGELVIPSMLGGYPVTRIGDYAFKGCAELTSVTISDNVKKIGKGAFSNCTGLKSITIGNGVTSVGSIAFSGCTGLTKINWNAEGVNNFSGDDGIFANSGTESDGIDVIFCDSVKYIPTCMFYTYRSGYKTPNIKSVTIGNNVRSIGRYAFYHCDSLKNIIISDGVTNIDTWAFDNTAYYKNSTNWKNDILYIGNHLIKAKNSISGAYEIENGTKTIAENAFFECSKLTSVTIPDSVTNINNSAFEGCKSLTKINWNAEDADNFISSAFSNVGTESEGIDVVFGDSVKSIPAYVFNHVANIKSITIGNNVASIGSSAFNGCTSLTSITVDSENKVYHSKNNCIIETKEKELVVGCKTSVIPSDGSVTSIGGGAFYGCTGLTSIIVPDSVTSIGGSAFGGCNSLTSITIGNSVTNIVESTFSGCTSLTRLTVSSDNKVYHSKNNCIIKTKEKELVVGCKTGIIPSDGSVTSIGNHAFYGCTGLTSITIPDSVMNIGDYAFNGCTNLTSITIPDSVTSIGYYAFSNTTYYNKSDNWENDVLYIGNHLIKAKNSISGEYEIRKGTKTIAYKAFDDCNCLTSITISDSITNIDDYSFYGCTGLTSVTIGDSVTSIGNGAFRRCTGLTSVTIPDSVMSIGGGAFSGCTGLTSITIPSDVTSIEEWTFSDCTGLTSVTIPDSVLSIEDCSFYRCNRLISLTIPDSVINIGDSAFFCCNSLTNITIGNNVTTIADEAFNGCTGLTSITIPDSVKFIGAGAFLECTELKNIYIPKNVDQIGETPFAFCEKLESITVSKENKKYCDTGNCLIDIKNKTLIAGCNNSTIPTDGSVEKIEMGAFALCSQLTYIIIPTTVRSIGEFAFAGTGIIKVTIPKSVKVIGEYALGYDLTEEKLKDFKIYGYAGTAAEDYAIINNFEFINLDDHTHEYSEKVITTPTCSKNGEKEYKCDCGDSYKEAIPALDHDLVTDIAAKNPTCTEIGNTKGEHCTRCDYKVETKEISALGHDMVIDTEAKDPTCTKKGTTEGSHCTRCNYKVEAKVIPEIGHVEKIIPAKNATCTDPGYTEGVVCVACGTFIKKIEMIPALGHDMVTDTGMKVPTCTEAGRTESSHCTRCDYKVESVEISAKGHSEEIIAGKRATCLEPGYTEGIICVVCGKIITEQKEVPSLGHHMTKYAEAKYPTCTESGTTEIDICTRCDYKVGGTTIPALGHTEEIIKGKPATCTESGLTDGKKCSVCGEVLVKQKEIPSLGHDIVIDVEAKDATCTEPGTTEGLHCVRCDYKVEAEEIPALGHYMVTIEGKPATCTESGLTEGEKCSVCGVVLEEQKEVPALGHDFVIDTEAKEPTCTEPGTTEGSHCTRCDHKVEAEEIPALGHTDRDGDGKCDRCGYFDLIEGECGNNAHYKFYPTGELVISGTGSIEAKIRNLSFAYSISKVTIEDGITEIGDEAFYNCTGLTSIEIPDSVTSIGRQTFSNCRSLTSITIPDSVTSIGEGAFFGCTDLTSVTIPDNVTSIGHLAFSGCTGLTNVTIGNSVTSIGYWAFSYCENLEEINVADENSIYHSTNNCVIKTATKELVVGCKSSIIPTDGSVTSIGNYAFSGCTGLTSITIPDSVMSIGNEAFRACTGLTQLTVSSGNKVYHSENNCIIKTNEKILVVGCKTGVIPSDGSVTSIGDVAFSGCTGLTSITIPDSVTGIGDSAFSGCTGLTSITIPDSVTSIDQNAFSNTAYYNNSSNWENSVLYIGNHLIISEDSISGEYKSRKGTKTIANYAFSRCKSLTSITIPDSVTSIGMGAFYGCTGLTNITIPYSVTSIDYGTFYGCTGLTSITIPYSVTSIGREAFRDCTGLTSIAIPDSVMSIDEMAFYNCTGLTKIYWNAESVSDFGENNYVFSNAGTAGKGIDVVFGDNVKSIPAYLFYSSNSYYYKTLNIKSVTIGNSVTRIGKYALSGCTGLTSITIGNSVTSIGDYAFRGCTGLISITIPDSVTSIGDWAFKDCTGLTSVTIGNSVTSIDWGAFDGCTGLTSITIPDSVTSIGYYAFGYYYDYDSDMYEKIDNFTIYGYPNTAAETYATENGFIFVSLDDEHTHSFSEWMVTKEATCTEEGEETRSCSCGETQTRKIEKIDHVMFTVVEPSTCKVKGVSYDVCDMCNETFNYTVLPLAPHIFSAWTVTKKATCETAGEKTRTCSVCGTSETEEISALEHSFKHVLKNATCKEEGFEKDVCENCGKEINAKVLPVTAHTFSAWTVTKEATVFESGERVRNCSVCGFEEKETIEKLKSEEVKDEKTDISVICPDGSYNGKVEIEVKETFDGESYHILNSERENYKKSLFDITTFVDGKKAQPNGSVWVKIPLPESYNPEKTTVYHVTNEGKLEKIESHVEGGYIIFETTHFSYYAIVDEGSQINPSSNCSCACHKKGIAKFFFKIVLFFQKIFKKNKICKCGVWHY